MGCTVVYNPDRDCVVGTGTGLFDIQGVRAYLRKAKAVAEAHGTDRLITDLRNIDISISSVPLLAIPAFIAELGMDEWKRAVVLERNPAYESSIYIAATRKHGHRLCTFTCLADALDWIAQPEYVTQEQH